MASCLFVWAKFPILCFQSKVIQGPETQFQKSENSVKKNMKTQFKRIKLSSKSPITQFYRKLLSVRHQEMCTKNKPGTVRLKICAGINRTHRIAPKSRSEAHRVLVI